jgi:hypothetical protein
VIDAFHAPAYEESGARPEPMAANGVYSFAMLRIAVLAVLAVSVPTYAQARRGGPGNLEQKLDHIIKRLDRIEHWIGEQKKGDADREYKRRVESLHDFLRDSDRAPEARRGDRRRPDARSPRHRDPRHDRRMGRGDRHPMGRLPQIIAAAKRGDPQAKQMLMRLRRAIDEAIGKPPVRARGAAKRPGVARGFRAAGPKGEVQVFEVAPDVRVKVARAEDVKRVELARRKADAAKAFADLARREEAARAHYEKQRKAEYAKREKAARKADKDSYARMKKLMAESKRLQQEIAKLRKELAAQQR